ncbi:MAG TPA: ABC transporter ATP-binding protein [Candidatus Didemnitutus sp.]|jgi:ABC-type polysaccharide/polyol phosphate transport system ATPase subunit
MPPTAPSADAIPAVSLRGVSKAYDSWRSPYSRLAAVLSGRHTRAERFTALHPLNLEVAQGECLGIIGRNGAGKSTLLQLIAGTLRPTSGKVTVTGRVAALLELGSGFNPDFTGEENVHLNAAILGLSPAEIAAKYDAIVAYSGIGEFIDRPVRTYSSGMTLRLAFAVCVHVDADIVIIDEALAVGDARFQFKCHATLDQLITQGRTVIFVSHDTNSVKRICRSAILIEHGEILLRGSPNDVTNIYTKLIASPLGIEAIREDLAALQTGQDQKADPPPPVAPSLDPREPEAGVSANKPSAALVSEEREHRQISDKEYSYGGQQGCISSVEMTDDRGRPFVSFVTGSLMRVRIVCEASAEIPDPIYAITLKDVRGQEVFGTNTYFQNQTSPPVSAGKKVAVVFEIQMNLLPGVYFASLGWVRLVDGEVVVIHRRYDVLRFDVLPCDRSFGIAYCPTRIKVDSPV